MNFCRYATFGGRWKVAAVTNSCLNEHTALEARTKCVFFNLEGET